MDAFESLVAGVLQRRERLWVWQNFKIELSAAQKAALGKPSHPRIDVDVLAYDAVENRVLWVECKSYLDSSGVSVSAFDGTNPKFGERFKVFTDARYREVAAEALIAQLVQQGLTRPDPSIGYWLVAGRVAPKSLSALSARFAEEGWVLRDRSWITESLRDLAKMAYDDDVVMMAAKLLNS